MASGFYICNTCKKEDKEFIIPADEIGVELMKSHLWEEHQINVDHRKARKPEEEIYLD